MKSICVYCGSSDGKSPDYKKAAAALGNAMADRGLDLVYGGASIGLMGTIADTMLERGRKVTGIIPTFLQDHELGHKGLTELRIVADMHERKADMAALCDGFIALPGGFGTLEELMEVATWQQLDQHQKPIGVLNVHGYYDALFEFLSNATDAGFLKAAHLRNLLSATDADSLLQQMTEFEADPTRFMVTKIPSPSV